MFLQEKSTEELLNNFSIATRFIQTHNITEEHFVSEKNPKYSLRVATLDDFYNSWCAPKRRLVAMTGTEAATYR